MKKNIGSLDRALRLIVAAVIGILIAMGELTGLAAILLGILAVVFLLTSVVGTCPLYLPLNISTAKKKDA